jgi:hypothetical protein
MIGEEMPGHQAITKVQAGNPAGFVMDNLRSGDAGWGGSGQF